MGPNEQHSGQPGGLRQVEPDVAVGIGAVVTGDCPASAMICWACAMTFLYASMAAVTPALKPSA